MKHFVVLPLIILIWVFLTASVCCQTPAVVNIGAVFTFNSVIGRAARVAMNAAVYDVNRDPRILNGTKLNLIDRDSNCSVFLGSVGGTMELSILYSL